MVGRHKQNISPQKKITSNPPKHEISKKNHHLQKHVLRKNGIFDICVRFFFPGGFLEPCHQFSTSEPSPSHRLWEQPTFTVKNGRGLFNLRCARYKVCLQSFLTRFLSKTMCTGSILGVPKIQQTGEYYVFQPKQCMV